MLTEMSNTLSVFITAFQLKKKKKPNIHQTLTQTLRSWMRRKVGGKKKKKRINLWKQLRRGNKTSRAQLKMVAHHSQLPETVALTFLAMPEEKGKFSCNF